MCAHPTTKTHFINPSPSKSPSYLRTPSNDNPFYKPLTLPRSLQHLFINPFTLQESIVFAHPFHKTNFINPSPCQGRSYLCALPPKLRNTARTIQGKHIINKHKATEAITTPHPHQNKNSHKQRRHACSEQCTPFTIVAYVACYIPLLHGVCKAIFKNHYMFNVQIPRN